MLPTPQLPPQYFSSIDSLADQYAHKQSAVACGAWVCFDRDYRVMNSSTDSEPLETDESESEHESEMRARVRAENGANSGDQQGSDSPWGRLVSPFISY